MSYEDAPATALVASACCVCGRPLLEAESIKSGIGPVCAEKTGFGREGLSAPVRAEVNRLVYELAALQRVPEAAPRIARLRELGFEEIASRIEDRITFLVTIQITLVENIGLVVELPPVKSEADFSKLVNDLRTIPGRTYRHVPDRVQRINVVPNTRSSIRALYRTLARNFEGFLAKSPKGLFVVPNEDAIDAAFSSRQGAAA